MPAKVTRGRIHGQTKDPGETFGHCASCDQSYPLADRKCPVDGSLLVALPTEQDEMIGRVLDGRFELKERIGKGGMGTVYRAFQASVSRDVAVKIISSQVTLDTIKRFMREARLSSRLAHPNTVTVHDFGQTHDGVVYLVMELIEGLTLTEWLESRGPLPRSEFVDFAKQLCDAIDAAHMAGIVHRDLKACNIMIVPVSDRRHRLTVLDFGLAKSLNTETSKLSTANIVMGTPAYMAPELIENRPADKSSDLYALGCTLFEMATGTCPFDGQSVEALFSQHLHQAPPMLNRSDLGPMPTLIGQLMAKASRDRPQRASVISEALAEFDSSSQAGLTPVPLAQTLDSGYPLASATPGNSNEARPRVWLPWALLAATVVIGAVAITSMRSSPDKASLDPGKDIATSDKAATEPRSHTPATQLTMDAGVAIATRSLEQQADAATTLEQAKVTLRILTSPIDAKVSISGSPLAQTPLTHLHDKSSTPITLRFTHKGYKTLTKTITPDSDKSVTTQLVRKNKRKEKDSVAPDDDDPQPIFRD